MSNKPKNIVIENFVDIKIDDNKIISKYEAIFKEEGETLFISNNDTNERGESVIARTIKKLRNLKKFLQFHLISDTYDLTKKSDIKSRKQTTKRINQKIKETKMQLAHYKSNHTSYILNSSIESIVIVKDATLKANANKTNLLDNIINLKADNNSSIIIKNANFKKSITETKNNATIELR